MSHTKRALKPLKNKKQKIDNRDKWQINGHISPHGCRCRLMIADDVSLVTVTLNPMMMGIRDKSEKVKSFSLSFFLLSNQDGWLE
jgi:hypothetical protein